MSKFKVGDRIEKAHYGSDGGVITRVDEKFDSYIISGEGWNENLMYGMKWVDRNYVLVHEFKCTMEGLAKHEVDIEEAMEKVAIRKEMNIKEFFKPPVHKNVWAIKRGTS